MLANRQPWAHDAALLFSRIESGHVSGGGSAVVSGYVAAHTVTTLYYLLAKARGRDETAAALVRLLWLTGNPPLRRREPSPGGPFQTMN